MTQMFKEELKAKQDEVSLFYKRALDYFESNNLIQSAEEFVKILKPFLSNSKLREVYLTDEDLTSTYLGKMLLDSMYHLGLIYLKDNQTSYQDSYSKAAAIFQYCAGFAKKYKIDSEVDYLKEAYLTEQKFLASIVVSGTQTEEEYFNHKNSEYSNHKSELESFREEISARVLSISEMPIEEIKERAKAVEDIYKDSTGYFVSDNKQGLLQRLLADCKKELGEAPCEFAIVGLGSLAGGR